MMYTIHTLYDAIRLNGLTVIILFSSPVKASALDVIIESKQKGYKLDITLMHV